MTLAEKIIQKCESSKVDWRKGQEGNRSLAVQQSLLDEIGRRKLLEEAVCLKEQGLVKIKWLSTGFDIEKVVYQLKDMERFYELAGLTPKWKIMLRLEREVESRMQDVRTPWILAVYQEILDRLSEGKIPDMLEDTVRELYFVCFSGLDRLDGPVFKRIFSKKYLHGSKVFERRLQSRVVTAARKFLDTVDDNMDDSQVLIQINVEEYSQELALKGNLLLELEGKNVDLSLFPYGVVLNSQTLSAATFSGGQEIRQVITVENKANYVSMAYEEGTLIIFSHGYFSPKEREFLVRLRNVLDGYEVEYYHSGDLDYGGVRIFQYIRKRIFPELKPLKMDVETFERFYEFGEPIDKEKREKLKKVEEPLLQPLIERICETGIWIEQESFLLTNELENQMWV